MAPLFLYCRPGFEKECAAEIQALSADHGVAGYCSTRPQTGHVLFTPTAPAGQSPTPPLELRALVFTRQWFSVLAHLRGLPPGDRLTPVLGALGPLPEPVAEVWLETPDTNEAKALSRLCRALHGPLRAALAEADLLGGPQARLRLHLCLLGSDEAVLGYSERTDSAPWPGGVPRLKASRHAPSRASLKLEEALLRFVGQDGRNRLLRPGVRAVDLGAAPGGWTWLLTQRGVAVTAVDNGLLAAPLRDSPLIEHLRCDGLRYRPPRPVDWMVCDIVEQPIRIAALALRWLREGWCRRSIFNLKLPMKKRYAEVCRCLAHIESGLAEANVRFGLQCKQLYHDREEVTVYLERSA